MEHFTERARIEAWHRFLALPTIKREETGANITAYMIGYCHDKANNDKTSNQFFRQLIMEINKNN